MTSPSSDIIAILTELPWYGVDGTERGPLAEPERSSHYSLLFQQCRLQCTKADTADIVDQRTEASKDDRLSMQSIPCYPFSKDRMTRDHSLLNAAAATILRTLLIIPQVLKPMLISGLRGRLRDPLRFDAKAISACFPFRRSSAQSIGVILSN